MRPELQLFYRRNDYSSYPLRLMGECNRSYIVPRLGTLFDNPTAITRVHIEPAVNFDRPAHYTQILALRKCCLENHHQDLRAFALENCTCRKHGKLTRMAPSIPGKSFLHQTGVNKHSEAMFFDDYGVNHARRPPLLAVL